MSSIKIIGNVVDVFAGEIFTGEVIINDDVISKITRVSSSIDEQLPYVLPGFVDSHVHIESSMLVPSEFAKLAVVHGTVATVSDPHEIANVCGMQGIEFMINNGNSVNFKFYFGAPSCVPATVFETAGGKIDAEDVEKLLSRPEILYLSEMMNFPGVLNDDPEVKKKIRAAVRMSKPVDGHAPGLRGEALVKYIGAAISTDHECFTREEALEKLSLGMKVIIREGSAAKNFEALIDLLNDYPDEIMFCSDDKHPDSLVKDHINALCRRARQKGVDVFRILKAASVNPVLHYRLNVGLLRENDPADLIIARDLRDFTILATYINGRLVAENGKSAIQTQPASIINNFKVDEIAAQHLVCPLNIIKSDGTMPVIEALDGQLITRKIYSRPRIESGNVVSDPANDVLKLVVVNRYSTQKPSVTFVKNFGFRKGAIASTVAHDSHNIIAVGVEDADIRKAVNLVIQQRGGISVVCNQFEKVLPLPVAGLMSIADGYRVAAEYTEMDNLVNSLGSSLSAPYMTLSFMALLVIPSIKLSDKGLFDGDSFSFIYTADSLTD